MADSENKPTAPQPVWFNQVANYSPEIEPSPVSPHMVFTCADAQSELGDTTAMFAGFNLGWPYTQLYGGQLPAPINIVAINNSNGAVYYSPAYFSDSSVQRSVQLFLSATELASGEPEFNRTFVNAWFNVDLPRLLGLPPGDDTYNVCLWLDDLVTPMQTVKIAANSARLETLPAQGQVTASNLVNIRTSSHSPKAESGVIRTDGPIAQASNRVFATLPQDAFSGSLSANGNPPLTILGFTQKSRGFYWYSANGYYDKAKNASCYSFDFDPFEIVPKPSEPESVFIVTMFGAIRAEALWIPTEAYS